MSGRQEAAKQQHIRRPRALPIVGSQPPPVSTANQADRACDVLADALAEVAGAA
ncbi:MAG: hypothetical protein WBF17_07860 [Phycisphaerae bacterium]